MHQGDGKMLGREGEEKAASERGCKTLSPGLPPALWA